MAFTKEQILEIQAKLASRGYKDTDFDEITALDGDEIVALVKGNKNVRTTVTILLSALSDLGEYYEYVGMASPADNPGVLGKKLFFLAYEAGSAVYTNFGNILVSGEIAVLKYDPANGWEKETIAAVDQVPRAGSTNLVTSGGVTTALNWKQNKLNAGTNIRLDDQPDGTTTISAVGGTGPGGDVQFDDVPRAGSYNAVYSNGIYTAIQNVSQNISNVVNTKADDSNVMHLTGKKNESANGVKTFTDGIVAKSVSTDALSAGTGSFTNNVKIYGNLDAGPTSVTSLTSSGDITEGGTKLVNKYMGINAAYTKSQTDALLSKKQNLLVAENNSITLTPQGDTVLIRANSGSTGSYVAGPGIDISENNVISNTVWTNGSIIEDVGGQPVVTPNPHSAILADSVHGSNGGVAGQWSVAEGYLTSTENDYAHAEGYNSRAQGVASHAEGGNGVHPGGHAKGDASHAEGIATYAFGFASHSEGIGSEADGNFSHTSGEKTRARNSWEAAFGRANLSLFNGVDQVPAAGATMDESTSTLYTIGIGNVENTVTGRKNAFMVMQDGSIYMNNIGGYTGTTIGSGIKSLQTVISDISQGGSGNYVTLNTDQNNITGGKFFTGRGIYSWGYHVGTFSNCIGAFSTDASAGGSDYAEVLAVVDSTSTSFAPLAVGRPNASKLSYKKLAVNVEFLEDWLADYVDLNTNQFISGDKSFEFPIRLIDENAASGDLLPSISLKSSGGYVVPIGNNLDGTSSLARFQTNTPVANSWNDAVNLGYLTNNYPSNSTVTNIVNTQVTTSLRNNLVAGTGISITPVSGTDNLRISATGGGSGDVYTEVYYDTLMSLRRNGELVPGMKYRIIDYETLSVGWTFIQTLIWGQQQYYFKSAGHRFDLVVTAISETELSEEASAVHHSYANPSDDYFRNSDLESWKIWYSADNDQYKYCWADFMVPFQMIGIKSDDVTTVSMDFAGTAVSSNGTRRFLYGTTEDAQTLFDSADVVYAAAEVRPLSGYMYPQSGDTDIVPLDANYDVIQNLGTRHTSDNGTSGSIPTEPAGKGVIYRMIDEYGNDCPYDFKNIMFWRTVSAGFPDSSGTLRYVYTFSAYDAESSSSDEQSKYLDATMLKNYYSSSVGYIPTHDNVIKPTIFNEIYEYAPTKTGKSRAVNGDMAYWLNEIILYSAYYPSNNSYVGAGNCNTFECGCYKMELRNVCTGNTFGNNCVDILLDNSHNNVFKNGCHTVRNKNILANAGTHTTECNGCTFGNGCSDIDVRTQCSNITVGNGCTGLRITDYCENITFGNGCDHVYIGSTSADPDTHFKDIHIGDGCMYVAIAADAVYDSQSPAYVKNITVGIGYDGRSSQQSTVVTDYTFNRDRSYEQVLAQKSNGTWIKYTPADLYNN